ncbi:tRNA wybutosine-synthesizing protein 3 homolog [Microtus ochrogaster]|uniref:tRNA wybutosine-synthesizing protein 3 homolog n=1 Tax=Microtus ochrogaster TaxID=79684 RepID=A0ABM0L2D3_MICOH|nr:tRNA wybutosine-synthesizing protein 3 homolog [Microtus ochrogaster]
MDLSTEFSRWKAQSLSKADLSRKGSVDEDAVAVVEDASVHRLKPCPEKVKPLEMPFKRQLRCSSKGALGHYSEDLPPQHSVAIDSGFRNSGITVGKRGKTMLAVRSTHGLEVPLSHKGKLMVTEEYIEFLLTIANQKMEENKRRIERFYNCLQHAMERKTISNSHSEIKEKNNPLCTRKSKRNREKAHDPSVPEDKEKELEGGDSLGISAVFSSEGD